jgi:catechol 2,3-dioxygenase-like lactoylglutathione lyase family enzyme
MPEPSAPAARVTALGARVHLFVRPELREAFTALFRDVLGCEVAEREFGLPYPVLLVSFGDGSAFSVEFSELAPEDPGGPVLDDERAFRGAWIEFRATDVPALQRRLRDAGVREFTHPGSPHAYFAAPGGQVFRLLDVSYRGP